MIEPITKFRNEHFFLSNFYESPITCAIAGKPAKFTTAEHAFQAFKIEVSNLTLEERETWLRKFENASTPKEAKQLGEQIPIDVKAWNKVSSYYMWLTLFLKFSQNPELIKKLVHTGERDLLEGNSHGDTIWGVDEVTLKGENKLGQLLMKLRKVLAIELPF